MNFITKLFKKPVPIVRPTLKVVKKTQLALPYLPPVNEVPWHIESHGTVPKMTPTQLRILKDIEEALRESKESP